MWLLVEVLAFALFASSLYLLMGLGGMVSFGHAAYFGLGAYGAALLMKLAGAPMPLAFVGGPVTAAVVGAVFGYFCVRLSSIYFAMLTLAFAQIVYAVVHQWDEVTGGDNGVLSVWPAPWLAGPVRYYYWTLAVAVVGLVALRRVTVSPFGLALRAARDHPRRAEAVGVDIRAHQLAAFVVAAFVAGLGGATFVFLKGSAFPTLVDASGLGAAAGDGAAGRRRVVRGAARRRRRLQGAGHADHPRDRLLVGGAGRGPARPRDRLPPRPDGDLGKAGVMFPRGVEVRGTVGTLGRRA